MPATANKNRKGAANQVAINRDGQTQGATLARSRGAAPRFRYDFGVDRWRGRSEQSRMPTPPVLRAGTQREVSAEILGHRAMAST